ncbi:hypothetical protein LIER_17689 [Lithospermum erythrorhizon]|uniref:NAC domain-containing protein n=1 Tax=Lithospermum erythrorhizon TaxID=34254 RepID=A0AAV3QDT6_LITER
MNDFSHVPPGFRFHPTDEELVDYYLRKKIASKRIDLDVIKDVDLYKIEPWDLQELCRIGSDEQSDWYFFSHKDKKYPTGTRTNRATRAGFWKATGRDKAIYSKNNLIGMRKTLVFYKGRAPNGQKSDWIMHEYRLETNDSGTSQEEGWVVCRAFKKKIATTVRNEVEHESLCWYDDQVSFMPNFDSQRRQLPSQLYNNPSYHPHQYPSKQDLDLQYNMHYHHHHDTNAFLHHLPPLDSPKLQQSTAASCSTILPCTIDRNSANILQSPSITQDENQVTDWRVLDRFVASQLSEQKNDDNNNASMEAANSNGTEDLDMFMIDKNTQEMTSELESVTKSSPQVDMWK